MKKMRRIVSFVLAMVMVMGMSMTAMAATITINTDLTNHTFAAYQIFKGTQGTQTDDPTTLGDVEWGSDIDANGFLAALKADDLLGTNFGLAVNAKDVAKIIEDFEDDNKTDATKEIRQVAKIAYSNKTGTGVVFTTSTTLDAGYYLIVDTTTNLEDGDAYNAALLQVTGSDITVNVKTDAPSVENKVKENVDFTGDVEVTGVTGKTYGEGYNDIADYNIGDVVPFSIYFKVPDMTYYDSYLVTLHNKLDAGLTFNESSAKVYVDGTEITSGYSISNPATDADTFDITFTDLKTVTGVTAGALVKVNFTATLNKDAVKGNTAGNEYTVYLEYSNNPNESASKGKTPTDSVVVFTYELSVTKVDGENTTKKLKDAEFVLSNSANKYAKITNGIISWADSSESATKFTSDANGAFSVSGLDAGTYSLEELKAPAGYNKLDKSIQIMITATMQNDRQVYTASADALKDLKVTVDTDITDTTAGTTSDGTKTTGVVEVTVENNKGVVLPSTGGMGTTIFYIAGGIMVAVAGVLLITRKRMNAQEK